MSLSLLTLFGAGLVLLGFEVFVPGAILGLLGGLFLLGAIAMAFVQHGLAGGLWTTFAAVLAVGLMVFLEFKILPRTRLGRRMFLDRAINGASQPPVADKRVVLGKSAKALTPLAPTGLVEVEGRRYEARCESGFAEVGTELRVVRVEPFHVVVTGETETNPLGRA